MGKSFVGTLMGALIGWKPKSYDPRVASARIRCLNPLSELRSRGYPVELFNRKRIRHYTSVIYSKLYDDDNYREARRLQERGVRTIVDVCDNHFYNPYGLKSWERAGAKLRHMVAAADYVVASTETLAEVIRTEVPVPPPIVVIGDPVETEIPESVTPIWQRWWHRHQLGRLLRRLEFERKEGRTPLVWFGIHGGPNADYGMLDLLKVRRLLEEMNRDYPLSLTVISNSRRKYHRAIHPWLIPTRYLEWSGMTFFAALKAHSVSVIPINQNLFTRCKTNNRLATALQAGLAVIADSIPSYEEFRGVACLDDWERGLRHYLASPAARLRDVTAGQALIRARWTLARGADQWQMFFDRLMCKYGCGVIH